MPEDKVAVVTGSNRGIGYEVVKNLCMQFSGVVYLTSRNLEDGRAARETLTKLGLKPKYHQLNVTNEESIANFAKFIKENHGGIDVLVNNAGVDSRSTAETFIEQSQICLATNYFGLVAVCETMFPLLRPHARVVNVSSCEGHLSKIPGQAIRKRLSDPTLTLEGLNQLVNEFLV